MAYEYLSKPVREKKPRRGLQRSAWGGKSWLSGAVPANDLRSERAQQSRELKDARKIEKRAKVSGCEYADYLRAQFRLCGCPFHDICRNRGIGKCHIHHVKEGSSAGMGQRGLAEDQIFLCAKCHVKGDSPGNSFAAMEAASGVNLRELAQAYSANAYQLGLLPVAQCSDCLAWHSRRYLTEIRASDGRAGLICERCSPVPEHL